MKDAGENLVTHGVTRLHLTLKPLIATLGFGGLLVCLGTLIGIAKLSNEVLEQESFRFDTTLLLAIHRWASPDLDRIMQAITQLGNPGFVVPLTGICLLGLWWRHRRHEAYVLTICALGGAILSTGLKLVFSKPRPQLWTPVIHEITYSYPSGHALGSMVLYGFLAYLCARRYPRWRVLVYSIVSILILAIGLSRLYLGVHWPSDVIGGYGIGFLWLYICTRLAELPWQRSCGEQQKLQATRSLPPHNHEL
ncbi:phosphatase PAP2 family protein [Lyngbya confervoides]|uniref:Phosphatase PAP2 family protein n=1 Tax=Lyngbya confervoides BDU141951 TaxID=1574623 RepID=A0ABD4T7I6_9CYAN|nr:phosphatase PAP2 family protein [Lyngbya confervoides]MCM1984479.1 phosphatase PAP2 family protein [Lyngbya confervoides BDU141951]